MRMRDMKDALKGQQKRLERAEDLLRECAELIIEVCEMPCPSDEWRLVRKVEEYLREPIDGAQD